MKCPHCLVSFHNKTKDIPLGEDIEGYWDIGSDFCPSCQRFIYQLRKFNYLNTLVRIYESKSLIRPKVPSRAPIPSEVPAEFREDYLETKNYIKTFESIFLDERVNAGNKKLAKEILEQLY